MKNDRDELGHRLRERGLRPTRARVWILQVLAGRGDHPTADQILQIARETEQPLSTATLYQNLHRLAGAGLLRRFAGIEGVMRFEANLEPHHHLVCARCGTVMDARLDEEQVNALQPVDAGTGHPIKGWKMQAVQIELSGLCPACQGD